MNKKYAIAAVVLLLLVAIVLIVKNSNGPAPIVEDAPIVEGTGENVPAGTNPAAKPKPTVTNPNLPVDSTTGTNAAQAKLEGKSWVWVSALYNDGAKVLPNKAGDFSLTLDSDGSFYATTDCNSISGKYQTNQNLIDFTEISSTKKYCVGSKEVDFTKILQNDQTRSPTF